MATEEEFIAELGKYINIKVLPQEKQKFALEIDGEEMFFEVKADDENYVKLSATDTWKISFRDDTTINFERKKKSNNKNLGQYGVEIHVNYILQTILKIPSPLI